MAKIYRRYNSCNSCHRTETAFRCNECDYDLCQACYEFKVTMLSKLKEVHNDPTTYLACSDGCSFDVQVAFFVGIDFLKFFVPVGSCTSTTRGAESCGIHPIHSDDGSEDRQVSYGPAIPGPVALLALRHVAIEKTQHRECLFGLSWLCVVQPRR